MDSKTISTLCLAILAMLLPGVAGAAPKRDEAADATLAKLATGKRAAMLKLTWDVGGRRNMNGFGAFISREGHALVSLEPLSTKHLPKVVTADGTALKFGTILRIFPDQGAALMKFHHRPQVIVPVAENEPNVGDTIALIPLAADHPGFGAVPPVVGEIMLKRKDVSSEQDPPRFLDVLSFGSGLSAQQRTRVTTSLAIDRDGKLVARIMGMKPYPNQTLMTLSSLALAKEIGPLETSGKGIKHPLSRANNPFDPVQGEAEFLDMKEAVMRRDMAAARLQLEGLMKRFPESLVLKFYAANLMILDPGKPLLALKDLPINPKDSNQARLFLLHSARSVLFNQEGMKPQALGEMLAAVEFSPKECPDMRGNLAGVLLQSGDKARAAQLYEEIYPYLSDTIHFVEIYEGLLNKLGKPKEADKLTDRFYELDSIYRRRRGEAR